MSSPAFHVEEGVRLLRLSLSTYAWVGRPIVEPFARLAELDIRRLQVFMAPGHFEGGEEETRALLEAGKRHGIEFVSLHAPIGDCDLSSPDSQVFDRTMSRYEAALALAQRLSARRVVIHPRAVERETEADQRIGFDLLEERLATLKRAARRHGVSVCVENLPGHDFSSVPKRLLALDHGQFCLDLGHAHLGGYLAPGAVRQYESRISVLHVHDNDGVEDLHLPPGRGGIDWAMVERELFAIGFHGEYCIEMAEGGDLEDKLAFHERLIRHNRFYMTD
ncbi:sugar phosphate isomerase/epimerase [bacterium]|nr:sugar phosphate isomerase/epimerase [bacterium]